VLAGHELPPDICPAFVQFGDGVEGGPAELDLCVGASAGAILDHLDHDLSVRAGHVHAGTAGRAVAKVGFIDRDPQVLL
jgi:hypothetical protein